jgi:Uncharacterized conserved protein (DUF2190)
MTDKMRWRYGDTSPVVAAVQAATVIEIGDLLWQDTDNAKPASALANQGSKAANQGAFASEFLGIAMQRSRAGDTAPVRVATTGVFEFDCPGTTFELGDLLGPDTNVAGSVLLNQQVAKVADSQKAVGRVARRAATASSSVLVDIRSTIMTGGVVSGSHSGA